MSECDQSLVEYEKMSLAHKDALGQTSHRVQFGVFEEVVWWSWGYSVFRLFLPFLRFYIDVKMPLIWTVPEQPPSHNKMRLAETATVSNPECLKPPYVGVTADSVIRLFLPFFDFTHGRDVHMTLIWTVPEQPSRAKRRAWLN